jgi:AcrR family transcriptional regulator
MARRATRPANGARPERDGAGGQPAQARELRARGRRTLRSLLEAGERVFAERGFHAARVDDIVKLAKTSHGTFYLYFSNKEDLFRTLVGEVAGKMEALAAALPPLEASRDGRAELAAWIERFCDLYAGSGRVIRAWTEAEITTSEFGRLGEGVLGGFSAAIARRLAPARADRFDPQVAALAIVAMLERLNYYALTGQIDLPRDRLVQTLTDVTYRALHPLAAPRPS